MGLYFTVQAQSTGLHAWSPLVEATRPYHHSKRRLGLSPARPATFCNSDYYLNFFPPTTAGHLLRRAACHYVHSHTYSPLPPRARCQNPLTSLAPRLLLADGLPAHPAVIDRSPATSANCDSTVLFCHRHLLAYKHQHRTRSQHPYCHHLLH